MMEAFVFLSGACIALVLWVAFYTFVGFCVGVVVCFILSILGGD